MKMNGACQLVHLLQRGPLSTRAVLIQQIQWYDKLTQMHVFYLLLHWKWQSVHTNRLMAIFHETRISQFSHWETRAFEARSFYEPDALCVTQPTVSKHWRMTAFLTKDSMLPACHHGCQDMSGTPWWLCGLPYPPASRELPSCDNNSVSDLASHDEPEILTLAQPTMSQHWRTENTTVSTIINFTKYLPRQTWST